MIKIFNDIIENYTFLSDWISQITEEALVEEDLNDMPGTRGVLQIGFPGLLMKQIQTHR